MVTETTTTNDSEQEVAARLEIPDAESKFTSIAGGVGNGLMFGMVPFMAIKGIKQFVPTLRVSEGAIGHIGTFGSVAGVLLGAVYGAHEAKVVRNYRQSITNEIQSLHDKLDHNNTRIAQQNAKITELQRALNAKEGVQTVR